MLKSIHHAALKVNDFAKALEFYNTLGLKTIRMWGEGDGRAAMLDTGNGILELFAGGKTAAEDGYFHLAFQSNDVDADYQKALAAGATCKMAPQTLDLPIKTGAPLKLHVAFVFAPTGEIVEFLTEKQ